MNRPFKITLKPGIEMTPEVHEWIRRAENVMNHPENAEPVLDRIMLAELHGLLYGHTPTDLGDGLALCGVCNRKWDRP